MAKSWQSGTPVYAAPSWRGGSRHARIDGASTIRKGGRRIGRRVKAARRLAILPIALAILGVILGVATIRIAD